MILATRGNATIAENVPAAAARTSRNSPPPHSRPSLESPNRLVQPSPWVASSAIQAIPGNAMIAATASAQASRTGGSITMSPPSQSRPPSPRLPLPCPSIESFAHRTPPGYAMRSGSVPVGATPTRRTTPANPLTTLPRSSKHLLFRLLLSSRLPIHLGQFPSLKPQTRPQGRVQLQPPRTTTPAAGSSTPQSPKTAGSAA